MKTRQALLSKIDHTILKPEATWQQVQAICDEALWADAASVCLSPAYVAEAARYLAGRLPVCTVVGFPHGTSTLGVKVFEAREAAEQGATELDMVIHVGQVKGENWLGILEELRAVKTACGGRLLKVIVETCLLTQEEKVRLCGLVAEAGAEYIKTSTGYGSGGATVEDVALFRACLPPEVKIKAAGGIRSWDLAQALVTAGAERIGSSALIPMAKQEENRGI